MKVCGMDKHFYFDGVQKYRFLNKAVGAFFKPLGSSHEKYIPPIFFSMPKPVLRALYMGLMLTDGSGYLNMKEKQCYTTCSKRLADDVSHLMFLLGFSPSTRVREGGHTVKFYDGYECKARTAYVVTACARKSTRLHL